MLAHRLGEWLLMYPVAFATAAFLGWLLWRRSKDAPGVLYLVFTLAAGACLLLLMVDTGWLEENFPAVVWGDKRYGVYRKEIAQIKESIVSYRREDFNGAEDGHDTGEKDDGVPIYAGTLMLKYPAVPESVLLWEGAVFKSPAAFTVTGRTVKFRTVLEPHNIAKYHYVVRYLQLPEASPETPAD